MFFDSVSLSRNSWHYKLQDWIFDEVPYTKNFCPYFWLTIFCIFAAPFKGLYVGAKYAGIGLLVVIATPFLIVLGVFRGIADLLDNKLFKPYAHKRTTIIAREMNDQDAFNLALILFTEDGIKDYQIYDRREIYPGYNKKRKKLLERWKAWKKSVGDWESRIAKEYAKREVLRAEQREYMKRHEELKRARNARRQKFFLSLIKYTKYLLILAVGIPLIYISYYIGVLILVLRENWIEISTFFVEVWDYIISMLPSFLIAGTVLGLLALTIYMLGKGFRSVAVSAPVYKTGQALGFFATAIKTFKKDNCPSIDWED